VIGLWPIGSQFGSLDAYAGGLIDAAESLGAAHVGIGSDMFGLGGSTALPGYEHFPQLAERLARRGANPDDVSNIMGRNYLRVLGQALAA
jgi:membrane dipeptidase